MPHDDEWAVDLMAGENVFALRLMLHCGARAFMYGDDTVS
jgi:hypothetical protein